MGNDDKKVAEDVGETRKLLEKTNQREEKVEEAIQERAQKIQQMEEDLAKMNAGGTAERITRRREAMENDAGEKGKGQRSPSSITLNGWVDWDRKMETMMDSADAKKLLCETFGSLPAHRRKVIDEEITYSDLSETVHHLKIMERGKEFRPIRNRILDMHRMGKAAWPEKLNVQVEVNPKKKPYVTEMGNLLRWLKKMSVTEYIKVEWSPLCSIAKVGSSGDIVATFRTSTGWKIDEKIFQALVPGITVSAEMLKNDLDDMD